MNRMFQPTADCLLFRLSNAAEHYQIKEGRFKVISQQTTKTFCSLVEAFLFYIMLDEEAALLDATEENTIIESKVKLCLN